MEISSELGVLETVGAEMELAEHKDDASETPQTIPMDSMPNLIYFTENSSDDEWDVPRDVQCLVCDKTLKSSKILTEHSKSHDAEGEATCNICQVTFSRMMSLSTHLENAHTRSVLHCQNCKLSFSNLWQLNKHIGEHLSRTTKSCNTETHSLNGPLDAFIIPVLHDHAYNDSIKLENMCDDHTYSSVNPGTDEDQPDPVTLSGGIKQEDEEMPLPELIGEESRSEDLKSSLTVIDETMSNLEQCTDESGSSGSTSTVSEILEEELEEMQSDSYSTNSSMKGDSDFKPDDTSNSDSKSETSGHSASSSPVPGHVQMAKPSQKSPASTKSKHCAHCGGGPFMNMDWHMKRCVSGSATPGSPQNNRSKPSQNSPVQPSPSIKSNVCGRCGVGPFMNMDWHMRRCDKLPPVCNICASIFPTEKALVEHKVQAHHPLPKPMLNVQNNPTTASTAQTTVPSSVPSQGVIPGVSNNLHCVYCGSGPFFSMVHHVQNCAKRKLLQCPICKIIFATDRAIMEHFVLVHNATVRPIIAPAPAKPQALAPILSPISHLVSVPGAPGSTLRQLTINFTRPFPVSTPTQSHVVPAPAQLYTRSPTPLRIMRVVKNESRELALNKRLEMRWRSKSIHRCRQCGVISRQPSLAIRHRYLHRGPRHHRCHCGRTFYCLLYLLRHCMQHAEATSYICMSCGETFAGAALLARHMAGTLRTPTLRGLYNRDMKEPMKQCKVPFSCHCGKIFRRASSYLWHQLQNRSKKF